MKFSKNKLLLIGGAIIILLIIFFLFFQTTTTTQNFSFSYFEMTKTISINGEERIETYEFNSENPIIAYLIVPKTIAKDVSQLQISGDYSSEIIEADPILLLTQNEYTPGTKKLTIKTPTGNKEHTTILLPINLTDYQSFSESEKQELTQTIKQFTQMDENYFTIEEVKQIIEEFAIGTQNNIGLEEKNNKQQIFFAETKNSQKIITSTESILDERITNPIENKTNTNNEGQKIIELVKNIAKERTKSKTSTYPDEEWDVTIEFSEEENYDLPKNINLFVSDAHPYDSLDFLFKGPSEDGTSKKPTITIETNELSDYLTMEISSEEEPFLLSASVEFPENHITRYQAGTTITINATIDFYLEKRETVKINVTFGECEQQLGDVLRQTELTEAQQQILLLQCHQEKISESNSIIEQDFNELIYLRNKILTRTGDSIEGEIHYQMCPEVIGEFTSDQLQGYSSCLTKIPAKEYALTKTLEVMTDSFLLDSVIDSSTCQFTNKEQLLNTKITPIEKGTQIPIATELSEKSELNEKRLLALNQNKTIDKNIVDYFILICEINKEIFESKKHINYGKEKLGKEPLNNDSTYLDAYASFVETISEINSTDEEIERFNGQNKMMQILYKMDILTNGYLPDNEIPHDPENGWNLDLDEEINIDLEFIENELQEKNKKLKNDYKEFSEFFNCDTKTCLFYKNYFSYLEKLVGLRKSIEENPNYWPIELDFAKTTFDLSNHLTTKEGLTQEEIDEKLDQAKKENAELLTNILIGHFLGELESERDLLNEVNKKTLEEIEENEPNYSVWFRPVKFMELQYIGSGKRQPTDYILGKQNQFFDKVTTKQNTLSMLLLAFSEDWNTWNNSTELSGKIDFFETMEKNYLTDPKFKNSINDRLFIKYFRLEKEIREFNKSENFSEQILTNFMKVEQEQTFGIALGYGQEEIFPIARIYYQEIIDAGNKSDKYVNQEVVSKAKNALERIKPELTWIENLGDWIKGEQETRKKELNKVTIDQRNAADIWLNRFDLFTDLRYWIAFEAGGAILKPITTPLFSTIGKSATNQFGKIATWRISQYTAKKIAPKLKPTLSFFNKTAHYLFYPIKKTGQTIQLTESKLLSKLYRASLKSRFSGFFTRAVELAASKPGYYNAGYSFSNGGFFGTKKWLLARQNLIKNGNHIMLWDKESALLAMKLIEENNSKGIVQMQVGNSKFGMGTMKNESAEILVLARAQTKRNVFGKPKTNYDYLTIINPLKNTSKNVNPIFSQAKTETISALVYLSNQNPQTKSLTPTLKTLLPITTDSTVIQTYTYNTAIAALKKGGVYNTRRGLISTIICNSPCFNPAPIRQLGEAIGLGERQSIEGLRTIEDYALIESRVFHEQPLFNYGSKTITTTEGYDVTFRALFESEEELMKRLSREYKTSPILRKLFKTEDDLFKLYKSGPTEAQLGPIGEYGGQIFDLGQAINTTVRTGQKIPGKQYLPTFATMNDVKNYFGIDSAIIKGLKKRPVEWSSFDEVFIDSETRKRMIDIVLDTSLVHESEHSMYATLSNETQTAIRDIYFFDKLDPKTKGFLEKIVKAYGDSKFNASNEALAYRLEAIDKIVFKNGKTRLSTLADSVELTNLDLEIFKRLGFIDDGIIAKLKGRVEQVEISPELKALLEKIKPINTTPTTIREVPLTKLDLKTTIVANQCVKGCSVQGILPKNGQVVGFPTKGIIAQEIKAGVGADFKRITHIDIEARVPEIKAISEVTPTKLDFSCNSPCNWVPSKDVHVADYEEVSLAVFKDKTKLNKLRIIGDFDRGYINNYGIITYNSQTNFQVPNNHAMQTLERLRSEKEIIGILTNGKNGPEIRIFVPEEITKPEIIIDDGIVLTIDNPSLSTFNSLEQIFLEAEMIPGKEYVFTSVRGNQRKLIYQGITSEGVTVIQEGAIKNYYFNSLKQIRSVPSNAPKELATKLGYNRESFLFEEGVLPVKGSIVNPDEFVRDVEREFNLNPYLMETHNGSEVFHGTQSSTIYGVLRNDGLRPIGDLMKSGNTPFTGTIDVGATGINQYSLSTVSIDAYREATHYAGFEETSVNLEEMQRRLNLIREEDAKYLLNQTEYPNYKNSYMHRENLANIKVLEERIKDYQNLTPQQLQEIQTQYPVVFGAKINRPGVYTPVLGSDVYHEIGLIGGANLDEIRVIYVPEERINEVQNLLKQNLKAQHIQVASLEKLTGEKIIPLLGKINNSGTTQQIKVFNLGNERSSISGVINLNSGESLIIGNGTGKFSIKANPLAETAATAEKVEASNNLFLLSSNEMRINNSEGKLFLENIGATDIATETEGRFVKIQKNTPVEITPSTKIKITHKYMQNEFVFSLDSLPKNHYFSNEKAIISSVEKKKVFELAEFSNLSSSLRDSATMGSSASRAFRNALSVVKNSQITSSAVLIETGSAARGEAVLGTDYDYGILFVQDGKLVTSGKDITSAKNKIDSLFAGSMEKEGDYHLDALVEEAITNEKIRLDEFHTFCTMVDMRFISGNQQAKAIIESLRQEAFNSPQLVEAIKKETQNFMSNNSFNSWSVKENKRELDNLLYYLKLKNKLGGENTIETVNKLVQKGAITQDQAERLLTQLDQMIYFRSKIEGFRQDVVWKGQTREFNEMYGAKALDNGSLAGYGEELAQGEGINLEEFKKVYTQLIEDNRLLINEIMFR